MSGPLCRMIAFCKSLLGLLAIAIGQRGRLGSSYWNWRRETAFGPSKGRNMARGTRWRAMLDFGRWSWMMRRG